MYNLLIVDDEREITDGIEELLLSAELGLKEIRKAYSAAQALELFEKSFFDIVLSDIRMPETNGLEMAEEMRRRWPGLRVIFLTGFRDFDYARQALRLGSDDYLLKPVPDEQLLHSVQSVLQSLDTELLKALGLHDIQTGLHNLFLEKQQLFFGEVLRGKRGFSAVERQADFAFFGVDLDPATPVATLAVLYNQTGAIPAASCHFGLLNALEETVSGKNRIFGIHWGKNTSLFLLKGDSDAGMKKLEELQSFFDSRLQVTFSAGRVMESTWEEWPLRVNRLVNLLENAGMGTLLQEEPEGGGPVERDQSSPILEAIKGYIQTHLSGDLSLSSLSERFRINPSYLSRVFGRLSGQQLSSFIANSRVERAKKLLAETDRRIAEIAREVGFENSNYFSKVFMSKAGCTPKEFRLNSDTFFAENGG